MGELSDYDLIDCNIKDYFIRISPILCIDNEEFDADNILLDLNPIQIYSNNTLQDVDIYDDSDTMNPNRSRGSVIKFNCQPEQQQQISRIFTAADNLGLSFEELDVSCIRDAPNCCNITKETFYEINKKYGEKLYEEYIKEKENSTESSVPEKHETTEVLLLDKPNTTEKPNEIVKKRPGRPRTSTKPRVKSAKKTGKIWQFLFRLLESQEHKDKIVWEDRNTGLFKFVSSDGVAKLWGQQRDKPQMNFEKFSRAMRYYYQWGILEPVVNQRLKYRFGSKCKLLYK